MKILIYSLCNEYLETISFRNTDDIDESFKKFSWIKGPLKAEIYSINESISSYKLLKLKNNLNTKNISILSIYSNNRDTVLSGKSLRIDSTFIKEQEVKNKFIALNPKRAEDILHEGTVRAGERISSNGNLCIIGDVNPGAIISAKKNIYVWGKLLGIAFAGSGGNNKASIASLYLRPLQLRIADVIAIGPKDKPKDYYPEIALIDKKTIIINPYIIETQN